MQFQLNRNLILFFSLFLGLNVSAQYKSFQLSAQGDTINAIDKKDLKQGKWVVHVDPLRGEPGYEDEGIFINNKKDGPWRRYTLSGDFIAVENYFDGGLEGKSSYFTAFGEILREESWHAFNPNQPYDTIGIYGEDNNQIVSYKIVKAEPYSVKDGEWKYFDPTTGRILKTEIYERGRLIKAPKKETALDEPMKKIKPQEVLEYEKKNSGKKNVKLRDGSTGN
ncbi:MAG: hypothetical protein ABI204_09305 [Ginsengibacter sp.]